MTATPRQKMTVEEYLAFERTSDERHEYLNGDIYLMVGASERHSLITGNILANLHPQLVRQGCRIYATDLRVKVKPTGLYTYPDLVVVCGESQLEDEHFDTLVNPTALFEVLSPSTEKYDRGRKLHHYREILSLQAYVLVSQDAPRLEQFIRRGADSWEYRVTTGLDATAELSSIQCSLPLTEAYLNVDFDSEAGDES